MISNKNLSLYLKDLEKEEPAEEITKNKAKINEIQSKTQ
jgi:hypothetical protein